MVKQIKITNGNKELIVSEKAFIVVYSAHGFTKVKDVEGTEPNQNDDVDLFTLSEAELQKVLKDDIKAFLDKEEIEYDSNATKDELIKIITGEE
nr:hypothetical protein [Fredinandcohnia onubensis]